MKTDIYSHMQHLVSAQTPFAVATVVETKGSVSAKLGAKAVIDASGKLLNGWIGGGCAESQCRESAVLAIEESQGTIIDIDLDDEMLGAGMPCGGSMRVFIEPVLPSPTLWILGHGRIAESLCMQAKELGLRVVINDLMADRAHFPAADELITEDLDYSQLTPQNDDYVVIATQHKGDHDSLAQVLKTDVNYIGLIASRKRANLVLDFFKERDLPAAQLERIRTPCGLNLGAKTPEEIAQSILCEITLLRRQGSGELMFEPQVFDHAHE
jgi:xanthine dehydrogenase accessory factor